MNVNTTIPLEVGSAIRDLPRMRRFDEEVLGCRFVSEVVVPTEKARKSALGTTGYAVARLPTSCGELIQLLALVDWRPAAAPPEYILDHANAFYLTFMIDDIDAVAARLQDEGLPA